MEKRSVAKCLILSFATCGFYSLIWFINLTDEINALAEEVDTSGTTALLLTIVTCGLYGFYWAYKKGEQIDAIKVKRGLPSSNGGVIYLILYVFGGIITYAILQHEINQIIEA